MSVQINAAINQQAFIDSVQKGIRLANQNLQKRANLLKLNIDDKGFRQPLGRITGDLKMFDSALAASNARVIAFGASTAVIGSISKAFKDLAKTTIEVEKAFTDINRILKLSTKDFETFGNQLFSIGQKSASSFQDLTKAALEFSRQGLKSEEALKRTSDALTLVRLTGINAEKAVSSLTATVNAFDGSMLNTTEALNKFVAVETKFAVGARDLVEALGRVGSSAQDAKVGFDELNAIVTSVQQTTGRGGAVIGNAMKTIFTRLQRQDTLEALEAYGVAVRDVEGQTLPAIRILQNFSKAYSGLRDSNQAYLREQVAGVFQGNILSAVLKDLTKQTSTYSQALATSQAASDEADQATARLNKSLAALATQTGLEFKRLQENIGKATFEPIAKSLLDPLKAALTGINDLLDGEGAGSDIANAFLKGIGNIIGGPGLVAIAGTIGKIFINTTSYIAKALPALVGITTQTQRRAELEEFIASVLQKESDISRAIAGYEGDAAKQAGILANYAEMTAQDMERQQRAVQSMASQMATMKGAYGAASVAMGGKRAASGFIPGMAGEVHDIKRGVGGVSPSSRPVTIPNFAFGGGVRGTMIANTGEYIVPNFSNGGSAIFNPNMIAQYGMPKGARPIRGAGGYVPNFAAGGDVNRAISVLESLKGKRLTAEEKRMGDEAAATLGVPASLYPSAAKGSAAVALSKYQKKSEAQKARRSNVLDATNIAHMFVPKVGGGSLNYLYPFAGGKGTQQLAKQQTGKDVDGMIFSAFGPSPNASQKVQQGGNVAKIDSVLENALVSAARKVIKQYSPALADLPINKQKIEDQFLKEGGQGAMGAFKGALFEAIVSRLIGQKYEKGAANTTTLDIFLSGTAGKNAQDLFNIPPTHRIAKHADVKSDFSGDNRGKFVKQVLKNFGPSIPLAAGAHGYIPNFAALGDAVEREAAAGVPLSSIRVNRSSKLVSPNNPAGLAVTNRRDEPNGLADVMRSSRGYIPNFAVQDYIKGPKGGVIQSAKKLQQIQERVAAILKETVTDQANQNKSTEELTRIVRQRIIEERKQTGVLKNLTVDGAVLDREIKTEIVQYQTSNPAATSTTVAAGGFKGLMGRIGGGSGMGSLAFATVAPMLAGGIQQATGGSSGIASALTQASTGQFLGSSLGMAVGGPVGAGIGGLLGTAAGAGIGYLMGSSQAAAEALDKLRESTDQLEQTTQSTSASAEEYIQALQDSLTAGTEKELEDAQKRMTKNFDAIVGTGLDTKFGAAGENVEELTRALKEYQEENILTLAKNRVRLGAGDIEAMDKISDNTPKGIASLQALSESQQRRALFNILESRKNFEGGMGEYRAIQRGIQGRDTNTPEYQKFFKGITDEEFEKQYQEMSGGFSGSREMEFGEKTLQEANKRFSKYFNTIFKDIDVEGIIAVEEAATQGLEAFSQAVFDNTQSFSSIDEVRQTFERFDKQMLQYIGSYLSFVLSGQTVAGGTSGTTAPKIDPRQSDKNYFNITSNVNAINQAFERALINTERVDKLTAAFVSQRSELLRGAGYTDRALDFERGEGLAKIERQRASFQQKFTVQNLDKIKNKFKDFQFLGDENLDKLDLALTKFSTDANVGLQSLKDIVNLSKEATGFNDNQIEELNNYLDGLERSYNKEANLLNDQRTILEDQFELERLKRDNVELERELTFGMDQYYNQRAKEALDIQTNIQKETIRLRAQATNPRNLIGLSGSDRVDFQSVMNRRIADSEFSGKQNKLLEDSIARAGELFEQERLVDSNIQLINKQSQLIEAITTLTGIIDLQNKLDTIGERPTDEGISLKGKALRQAMSSGDMEKAGMLSKEIQSDIANQKLYDKYTKELESVRSTNYTISAAGGSTGGLANLSEAKQRAELTVSNSNQANSESYEQQVESLRNQLNQLTSIDAVIKAVKDKGIELKQTDNDRLKTLGNRLIGLGSELELQQKILDKEREITEEEQRQLEIKQQQAEEDARSFKTQFKVGMDEVADQTEKVYGDLGIRLPTQIRDGIVSGLESSLDGKSSFGDAMKGVLVDVMLEIRRAALKNMVGNIMNIFRAGFSSSYRDSLGGGGAGAANSIFAQNGMYISGGRTGDKNPAMLEDGEYVLNRRAVKAMGGKAALDHLNFKMAPRFSTGGPMMVNESVNSSRMSGYFLASDNPEIAEAREEARKAWEKKQQKKAEKEAMKNQFKSMLLSSAISAGVGAIGQGIQGRMADRAAAMDIQTASGGTLQKSGNFLTGYKLTDTSGGTVGLDQALSQFAPSGMLNAQQATNLGMEMPSGATSIKMPKNMERFLNKTIDSRIQELEVGMQGPSIAESMNPRATFNSLYGTRMAGPQSMTGQGPTFLPLRSGYRPYSGSPRNSNQLPSPQLLDLKQLRREEELSRILAPRDRDLFPSWGARAFQSGGRVSSGFSNRDSVPAFLAGGEYVMNNRAVKKYGLGFMGRLNGGLIPKMQAGGGVGAVEGSAAPLNTQNATNTNNISININMGGSGGSQGSDSSNGNNNASEQGNSDEATKAKNLSEKIRSVVMEVIQKEQRVGGTLPSKR